MIIGPSFYTFPEKEIRAKYNPYTEEVFERTKKLNDEVLQYLKLKDIIPYNKYESLKPLALEILYSFEINKLPYYIETNKVTEIIKILNKHI